MTKKHKLRYFSGTHNYFIGRKKLTSVTTFIGKFFEPFDAKGIARKLSKFHANKVKKHGVRYWLAEWKKAAEYGTKVHNEIETFINGTNLTAPDHRTEKAIGWMAGCGLMPVEAELMVFDEELGIAGTIDCLMEDKEGKITIVDWKTNKAIKKKSYGGTNAKDPISHLEDCNYAKYSLQLSLYRYILERMGYEVVGQKLVHLQEDNWVIHDTEYMKQEIEDMLR